MTCAFDKALQHELALDQPTSDAYARKWDPDTSRAAAESVQLTGLEDRVTAALAQCPAGATSFELADLLGLSLVTVSPRMRPLVDKGIVRDSTRRMTAENGRERIVWELCTPCGMPHPRPLVPKV